MTTSELAPQIHRGGCLCGGVRYTIRAALRDVVACHCTQCRRTSGHYVAATRADSASVSFDTRDTLQWYRSSDTAERGFCGRCGSNVFWRRTAADETGLSIMAGTLDGPTGLTTSLHIFVADRSDYYELNDGVPQRAGW